MKKEVLISVYDMEIGGVERSLLNMLGCFDYDRCNVSLLVCSHQGDFMDLIPANVNLLPEMKPYTVFRKSIIQILREAQYGAAIVRIYSKAIAGFKARLRNLNEGPGYIQMQLESKFTSSFVPAQPKEYDLAISYAWPHHIVVKKVRAKTKVAWIHTDFSKLEIDNKLDLAVWAQYDRIASVSDACTQSFLSQYPSLKDKITVIENITSPEFVRKLADDEIPAEMTGDSAFHIVSVGRLSHVKGYDMAIEALKMLHEKGMTDIQWSVIGYGGYEAELQAIIARHHLQDRFVLLGKKTNPYPFIKKCDLYVQPSRYEGKAVTVTEAQILRKPVLITNYPTASSQVEDGVDGIICEVSPAGIADAIERLYRNEQLRNTLVHHLEGKNYSNSEELNKLYRMIPA